MKIISKFKDYYDSVSHQYLDKETIYFRKTETVNLECRFGRASHYPTVRNFHVLPWTIRFQIIGFCGNFYPVIQFSLPPVKDKADYVVGLYSKEELNKFVVDNQIQISHGRPSQSKTYYHEELADFERFFNNTEKFKSLEPIFRKHNVPVFAFSCEDNSRYGRRLSGDPYLILNPFLKEYSFAKVKDPFSAHQELYQFIGGYLRQPEREMVEISDRDKIHKHGFDKWSFRRLPNNLKSLRRGRSRS